jgi:hypothetical protein
MWHVRRHTNEVARPGFVDEFEPFAPTKARAAFHHVDRRFEFAVMVRAGFGVGLDDYRAGPKFLRADFGVRNGLGARHARRLRRVGIQVAGAHDAQPVIFPVRGHGHSGPSAVPKYSIRRAVRAL